jgi:hypothetical protein
VLVVWGLLAAPRFPLRRSPHEHTPSGGISTTVVGTLLSTSSVAQDFRWSRFTAQDVGVSVDLPTDLFTVDRGPTKRQDGRVFATADGRADLRVYSIPNPAGDTPRSFFKNRLQLPKSMVYQRLTDKILAASGFRGKKIWYARCNFAVRHANCVALNYPAAEKLRWDAVVTRISHSLSSPREG